MTCIKFYTKPCEKSPTSNRSYVNLWLTFQFCSCELLQQPSCPFFLSNFRINYTDLGRLSKNLWAIVIYMRHRATGLIRSHYHSSTSVSWVLWLLVFSDDLPWFLVASSKTGARLYKHSCPSVRPCVRPWVGPHRTFFAYKSWTDDWILMIFRHMIDINETKK